MGTGRSARSVTPALALLGRLAGTLALVVGAVAGSLMTAQAQSGDSFEYDDDGVAWSVEWDGDVWEESSSGTSDLSLSADATIASFQTLTDVTEDPEECLTAIIPDFEEGAGAIDAEILDDGSGDPVSDATFDFAYEGRTFLVETGGEEVDFVSFHACYQLAGEAVLWVVTGDIADGGDDLADILPLFDGITVEGETYELGLADLVAGGGADDEDASPSARGGDDDEDASPSTPADDDEDASPSSRGGGDDDEDASPSSRGDEDEDASPSSRDDEDASPSSRSDDDDEDEIAVGADEDAGTYLAPTYGYSLSWDADFWTVANDLAAPDYTGDRDFLNLEASDNSGFAYIEGSDESWSDTDDCVETLFEEIDLDTADGEVVEDADGDAFEVSGDDRSYGAYVFEVDLSSGGTQDQIVLVECVADEETGIIVGLTGVAADDPDYVEDIYPIFGDLLATVSFDGTSGGTPEASRGVGTVADSAGAMGASLVRLA